LPKGKKAAKKSAKKTVKKPAKKEEQDRKVPAFGDRRK
jgi:hypothetical protein